MFDKIGTSQWYWMLSLVIARKENKDVVAEKTQRKKWTTYCSAPYTEQKTHLCFETEAF